MILVSQWAECECPISNEIHTCETPSHRHSSKGESALQASVTTAVVASPLTMLANGHKTPRLQRSLTSQCLWCKGTRKGTARQVTFRCPRSPIASMLATSYGIHSALHPTSHRSASPPLFFVTYEIAKWLRRLPHMLL